MKDNAGVCSVSEYKVIHITIMDITLVKGLELGSFYSIQMISTYEMIDI